MNDLNVEAAVSFSKDNPIFDEEKDGSGATGVSIADLAPQIFTKPTKSARWGRLETIEIQNFKAIESLEIPVGDVTILVGPNGAGKSSILQAIHWAARSASYIPPKNTKEVVSFDRLDYLPSSEPLKTAYKRELSSDTGSKPTLVSFKHLAVDGEAKMIANVKIWAARNRGGISVHIDGGAAVTPFKQRKDFITAYIPGLAGLSEKETILVQPLLRRQAASGDAGGVLRNVLFNLASRLPEEADDTKAAHRVTRLNELVKSIHPGVELKIGFDEREDVNIQALFSDSRLGGALRPLEAAATGVLQVVQIFAYVILFRPKLLLVDEPDAHLHPDKQERLIEALEQVAKEFKTQVIITTHSPHVVRAASESANLVWVRDGKIIAADDDTIRRLLGWGGLDKKCIFFVEDEEDKAIRALLKQWPNLNRQITVCRCFGIDNLPKNKLLEGLSLGGGLKINSLIHRDRDFMTEKECEKWSGTYKADNTFTWCTDYVDVEAYFCQPEYISKLYEVSLEQAIEWLDKAASNINCARDKFFEKRILINYALYKNGGTPESQTLWDEAGGKSRNTVLGKKLLAALKPIVTAAGKDEGYLNRLLIPSDIVLAESLKDALTQALT
jgi:ABC-type lipoprotein export system ATPase subunit